MRNPEILAVGGVYKDIISNDFPLGGVLADDVVEVVGGKYRTEPGGSAMNFVRVATAMGVPAVFVGKVGDDYDGWILNKMIRDKKIPVSLIVGKGESTNISFNVSDTEKHEKMLVVGSANESLTGDEVGEAIEKFGDTAQYVVVGSCLKLKSFLPTFHNMVEASHKKGAKVVVDHGRIDNRNEDPAYMKALELLRVAVPHSDIYLPSREEFFALWNVSTMEDGFEAMRRVAPDTTVVVKDAENGAFGFQSGEIMHMPAFSINVDDPFGAGDAFNTGFLVAIKEGQDFRDAMKYGCATAAVAISEKKSLNRKVVNAFAARRAA